MPVLREEIIGTILGYPDCCITHYCKDPGREGKSALFFPCPSCEKSKTFLELVKVINNKRVSLYPFPFGYSGTYGRRVYSELSVRERKDLETEYGQDFILEQLSKKDHFISRNASRKAAFVTMVTGIDIQESEAVVNRLRKEFKLYRDKGINFNEFFYSRVYIMLRGSKQYQADLKPIL